MRSEYKYLMWFAVWMALWTFLPWVAMIAMCAVLIYNFREIKNHRRNAELAEKLHKGDSRWMKLEGFEVQETEKADWWKV